MECEIIRADRKHSTIIVDFVMRLLTELAGKAYEGDREAAAKACGDLLSNSGNAVFLAQKDERNIGMVSVVQSIAIYAGGNFGIINELYVLPEFRSAGVGHLLINQALRFGEGKKWSRIEVGAPDERNWQRTVAFYQRENFIVIGPRLKKYLA